MVLGDVFLGQFTGKPCIGKSMNIYMVSPSLDSWSIPNTQMLHVWNIYLQDWVIFRVNVGNQLIINQQGNHRFSNDIHGVFRSIGVLPPIQRDRQKKKNNSSVSSSSIDRRPTCRTFKVNCHYLVKIQLSKVG